MELAKKIIQNTWALRCPQCKKGRIFKKFTIHEYCPHCKMRLRDHAEGWAGPALINYTITVIIVISLVFGGLLIFGLDQIQTIAIMAVLVGVVCNLIIYRYAHSAWISVIYFSQMSQADKN